jgi:hypothetical protein
MKKLLCIAAATAALMSGASVALAQSDAPVLSVSAISKVSYPVAELGNCSSRDACRLYCDVTANRDACFAYAQKTGLMSKNQIDTARLILSKKGPGQCDGKDACVAYCADSSHTDECLSFAQSHNVIASSTASLIKKLSTGEGPGACKSPATCKMYCEDTSHRDECRTFAEENGLARPMASSTMPKPRVGSSTMEQVKGVLASTTPGRERGAELHDLRASTTGNAAPTRPILPKPIEDNSLGASVLRGFAHLLGF